MVTRLSNSQFLTVLDAIPLENVGWELRLLSERDYASQIALMQRFVGTGFTVEENGVGGGQVVLDAQDRLFSDPLPAGEVRKVHEQQALVQVIDNGVVRAEWLAEDLQEDVVTEDGQLTTVISGRGTGSVLEWAKVLPAGMPTPTSMDRVFTAAPMAAWYALFGEAQADGFLTWVTPLFDGSTDSAGVPWGGAQDVKVQAGDSLLDLLIRFCEAEEYVWRMAPGFRLLVMKNPGQNRELDVVFTMFRDQSQQQRLVTRREIGNIVYASSGDGIAVAADTSSQAQWRKRAVWAQAGGTDASGRSAVANALLGLRKDQQESRTLQIEALRPGRQVFVDFNVSDTVGVEVPADSASSGARKVVAISLDIDADGVVQPELTLQSRFESRAIKQQKMLDAVGGSTAGAAGGSQIPVSAAVALVRLTDLQDVDTAGVLTGDVLMKGAGGWVDQTPNLNFLSDVDTVTVPPTDGQNLTYQASSGLWKPAAAAGSTHPWETVINLPGTTFNTTTDWTATAGTWSSNGSEIVQASTSGTTRAWMKAKVITSAVVFDAEVMVTAQAGADTQCGIVVGGNGTTTGSTYLRLHMTNATPDGLQIEQDALLARWTVSMNWGGLNVWKKLRLVVFGGGATAYLDGVLLGSAQHTNINGEASYIGLKTNTASAKFRNLKVWNPKMPPLP